MASWDRPAATETIERVMKALQANGIETFRAKDRDGARKRVLSLLPEGAEVFTMSSVTLETTGLAEEINGSGRYVSVRNALHAMSQKTQSREMRKLGAAPISPSGAFTP